MRKLISFVALVAIASLGLMTVGCNSSQKKVYYPETVPVTVGMTVDTVINTIQITNKTAPRKGCNGKKLKNDQLLGTDTTIVPISISQTAVQTVDMDCAPCLKALGISPDNQDNASSSTGSGSGSSKNSGSNGLDLSWLWPLLAGLLAIILAIWLASWLIKNWPKRNNDSSSPKTNSMFTNSVKNDERLAALAATAERIGACGNGKAYLKDNTPGNEMEMIVGATNAQPAASIMIKNNSGIIYIGNDITGDANAKNAKVLPVEPKKDEPVAPGAQQ